jgi:hypothetical protein
MSAAAAYEILIERASTDELSARIDQAIVYLEGGFSSRVIQTILPYVYDLGSVAHPPSYELHDRLGELASLLEASGHFDEARTVRNLVEEEARRVVYQHLGWDES